MRLLNLNLHSLKSSCPYWIPLSAFALFLPFSASIDLWLSAQFYHGNQTFSSHPLFHWFYDFGPLPAQLVASLAAISLLLSFSFAFFKKYQRESLALVLSLAIGSGLITHAFFKGLWGRPRPIQTTYFGGPYPFRPCYQPLFQIAAEPKRSFPCGHCTMGYYFFTPALIAKRKKKRALFYSLLAFTFLLGGFLSLSRLAQGGHFLSDILASLLIMWLTALIIDRRLFAKEHL